MHILDGANTPVLELDRPFTCTCMCQGLCVCQPNEMTIKLPAGGVLGRIVQDNHMCVLSLTRCPAPLFSFLPLHPAAPPPSPAGASQPVCLLYLPSSKCHPDSEP